MMLNAFVFATAWLALRTIENIFDEYVHANLPNYHTNLLKTENLRSYTSNAVSLVHALYATTFSLYCIYRKIWFTPIPSVAYFLYDFVQGCSLTMSVHHFFALLLILWASLLNQEGTNLVAPWVFLSELSTIFLASGGIMHGSYKLPRLRLSEWEYAFVSRMKLCFYCTFVLTRMMILPICLVYVWSKSEAFVWATTFLLGALQVLNTSWFLKILKKID